MSADLTILVTTLITFLIGIGAIVYGCSKISTKQNRLSRKDRFRNFYNNSSYGSFLELTNAFLSLFTCVMFIFNAYGVAESLPFIAADVVVTGFFITHYMMNLYMSGNRFKFIFSWQGIVDEVTIIPAVMYYAFQGYDHNHSSHSDQQAVSIDILRIYRIVKMFRVIRFVRLIWFSRYIMNSYLDAFFSRMLQTGLKLICYIIIVSGIVQLMDNRLDTTQDEGTWQSDGTALQFHDALYFTVVTLSTVGYGDISPPTAVGKLFVTVVILFFIVWVPYEVERLLEILRLAPSKSQIFLASHVEHIIIGCEAECYDQVNTFLHNYCHRDNGYNDEHILVVVPWKDEPGTEWSALRLEHGLDTLTLLRGDLQIGDDLERCAHKNAKSVFIFANRKATSSKTEDTVTMLRALSCKQNEPSIPVYVQLILEDSKLNLMRFGIPSFHIVCAEEVKNQLLSSALVWRGWTTVIRHLLIFACSKVESQLTGEEIKIEKEFINGLERELYVVNMTPWFCGQSFCAAALHIFNQHGNILIGLNRAGKVLLNPGWNLLIAESDQAILIAKDRLSAESSLTKGGAFALGQAFKNFAHRHEHVVVEPTELSPAENVPSVRENIALMKMFGQDFKLEDEDFGPKPVREKSLVERIIHRKRKSIGTPPIIVPTGRLLSSSKPDGHVVIISRTFFEIPALMKYVRSKSGVSHLREENIVVICPKIPDLDIDSDQIIKGLRHSSSRTDFRGSKRAAASFSFYEKRQKSIRRRSTQGSIPSISQGDIMKGSKITIVHGEPTQANLNLAQVHGASLVLIVGSRNESVYSAQKDTYSSRSIIDILSEVLSICKTNAHVVVELDDAICMEQVSILTRSAMNYDDAYTQDKSSSSEDSVMDIKDSAKVLDACETLGTFLPLSSGDFILDNLCDILLSQISHNENIIQIAKCLLSESNYIGRRSEVVQAFVPDSFWALPETPMSETSTSHPTFGKLFVHLLEEYDAVAVGLYRKIGQYENRRLEDQRGLSLVAPSHRLLVHRDDKVYVIANSSLVDLPIGDTSEMIKRWIHASAPNKCENEEPSPVQTFSLRNYKPGFKSNKTKNDIADSSEHTLTPQQSLQSPESILSSQYLEKDTKSSFPLSDMTEKLPRKECRFDTGDDAVPKNIEERLHSLEKNVAKILDLLEQERT